jgi:MoaA/NifB/PqqE/SkfB family radical SAM enzyme
MYLNVELTNTCNLHCPLCSTGSGFAKKPKGMMKLKDFKSFIDKCAPFLHSIGFFGSGEPLLHPEFVKFAAYAAKKKKLQTFCCTNGTLLKKTKAIAESGLQVIYVDIDGVTPREHRLYRVGANLETVLTNVKNLVQAKKKHRSHYPEIYIDTLIGSHNQDNYQGFIELAKQLGVNGIRFEGIKDDLYKSTDWLPTLEKFKHIKRETNDYSCMFKDTLAGILSWDGDMQLCCMTPNHEKPVIKLNAFREKNILERMDAEEFYTITKKAGDYPFCETCFSKVYSSYQETITFQ